jgi:hypothetical protein
MRNMKYLYGLLLTLCITAPDLFAQTWKPGMVLRTTSASTTLHASYFSPTVSSRQVLDPNGDGYVSGNTAGFPAGDDVSGSEINYKPIAPYSVEPYGDLRRGPSHLYSDFVPGIDNASYYMYYRHTAGSEALLFRMRLGSIMPGSKGYSILLDTDGKFGASGPNADPNYVAATTGTGGNAGFELEVDLFTQTTGQTGIAIYTVDGTASPALLWSAANWQDYSQTALASTSDNGDPDFFLDFFVPFSRLGITASTPIRAVATTVMAPQPAIGGPKSDIYGLADGAYGDANAQYEAFIHAQPQFTATTLGGSGTTSPTSQMCTTAPTLNSPLGTGTVTVSGSWAKNPASTVTTATIKIYINGTYSGHSTTVTSAGAAVSWSVSGVVVSSGQTITAKAVAAGEGECQSSNAVTALTCNAANIPPKVTTSCAVSANKGITGTNYAAGLTIYVDNIARNTTLNSATNPGSFSISGATWNYSGGCSNGSPMESGTYKVYYMNATGCVSEPIYFCVLNSSGGSGSNMAGTSATPTITTPAAAALTTATKVIAGTGEPNSSVALIIDGVTMQTVTASGAGAFSFSALTLATGQSVRITNVVATGTVTTSKCEAEAGPYTVACYTAPPVITTHAVTGLLSIGQPITGAAVAGSTLRLYNAANTLLATATVASSGTWTTSGAAYSNGFTGTAVAGASYYATCTSGGCTSAASTTVATGSGITPANRCGTITANAPSGSITSATTSITVAYANALNLKVTLYEDGQAVASQSVPAGSGTYTFDVANKLYAGNGSTTGMLSIGVQESGQEEVACSTTYPVNPACTAPAAPAVTPGGTLTVSPGQAITYTIQTPTTGTFYSISDGTTGAELATGVWAPSSADFSITTRPVTSTTTALVKAVVMTSAGEVCTSSATLSTVNVLPVTLLYFKGARQGAENLLAWEAAEELYSRHYIVERSANGTTFRAIGEVPVRGAGVAYSFTDHQPGEGTAFYRLRMVDTDGAFSYSNVVAIRATASGGLLSEVYPNPFTSALRLQLQLPAAGAVDLRLLDGVGRPLRTLRLQGVQGTNTVLLPGLDHLEAGVYVLTVQTGGAAYSVKVLKADK